jgi:hypothetical protein
VFASAIAAGATETQLQRLAAAHAGAHASPSLEGSLGVLSTLLGRGVDSDVLVASLERLVALGAGTAALLEFERGVQQDIARGRRPRDAAIHQAESALRAIESRRPPPQGPSS